MKLKHLESALSKVPHRAFSSPRIELEQYPTSAHLTAAVILAALSRGDVGPGLSVLDLGCGTGMLGIGCALVGCSGVLGIDCDAHALDMARANVEAMDLEGETVVEFVLAEVKCNVVMVGGGLGGEDQDSVRDGPRGGLAARGGRGTRRGRGGDFNRKGGRNRARGRGSMKVRGNRRDFDMKTTPGGETSLETPLNNKASPLSSKASGNDQDNDGIPLRSKCVDTVVTNPPFGTKQNAGIDMQFLQTATRLARRAVYSFHKSSTRDFLIRKVRDEWNMNMEVVAQMKFDIPNMYEFHKKKSVDVEVDLIRVFWKEEEKERREGVVHDGADEQEENESNNGGEEESDNINGDDERGEVGMD